MAASLQLDFSWRLLLAAIGGAAIGASANELVAGLTNLEGVESVDASDNAD